MDCKFSHLVITFIISTLILKHALIDTFRIITPQLPELLDLHYALITFYCNIRTAKLESVFVEKRTIQH